MNKKVLTLCAGFLLAGSLTAVAQYCPQNGEVDYRTRLVKSAMYDAGFKGVKAINPDYYYQLQVKTGENGATQVLTVERDYSTGKLYLTSRRIEDATLTHSLWKITTNPAATHGRAYAFENKETGYTLTFDHTNALQLGEDNKISYVDGDGNFNGNAYWNYLNDGLLDGCNTWWELFTTDASAEELGYSKVYSYFHNQADSVMYLAKASALSNEDSGVGLNAISNGDKERAAVDDVLFKGSDVIVTVKTSKAKAGDYAQYVPNALEVRPIVAGAKVLNAAEINSMIDADGSFLQFGKGNATHIAQYDEWADAGNNILGDKSKTKFTIINPENGNEVTVANNPLAGEFVAENSPYEAKLNRENWGEPDWSNNGQNVTIGAEENNPYAGYDILLRQAEAAETVNGKDYFKYLMVSGDMYDDIETGNYTAQIVTTAYYSEIQKGQTLGENKRIYYAKANETTADADPDPLEARYHWKLTYYPTNDSLVFEPLNASRLSQKEYNDKVRFEKSRLATAWGRDYYNTINEGKGIDENFTGTEKEYNAMYNKAKGVPVALYGMNYSSAGDEIPFLTVSAAGGSVESATSKYAAVSKFDKTTDKTKTSAEEGLIKDNPAYVTNAQSMEVREGADYIADMNLRLKFDHDYTYLTRATVKSGLYFINLSTNKYSTAQTEHRVDGAYIVEDMKGHVVYDIQEAGEQNFTHMPATQWVVEQQPCLEDVTVNKNETPVVRIWNREFNGRGVNGYTPMFEGQLYADKEDPNKLFTIDHLHYAMMPNQQTVDLHDRMPKYNCADTVVFNEIENPTNLGYFNEIESVLRDNTYELQHIFDLGTASFLGVDEEDNILKLVNESGDNTKFELFRANGWYPVEETKEEFNSETGAVDVKPSDTYRFEYKDSLDYGYPSDLANVQGLSKTFYKIKLKDANLIDNDHRFIAIDNQHKYVIATEDEIANPDKHLTFAIFTLKENNCIDGTHSYALINQPLYSIVAKDATKDDLKGLTPNTELKDEFGNTIVRFMKGETEMVRLSNQAQVSGKLVIEGVSTDAKIADLCETTTSVFALVQGDNKRYATLPDEYVNNPKKVIDLVTIDEQSNQSLYEDSGSKLAIANGLNYLAAENLGDPTDREGFYVDKVAKSSKVMPQYLFAVAADSVPAYTYCNKDGHGNHGINPTCDHAVAYPGYVEGRFLINFNDSINDAMINKLHNADKYKSNGYTRLGFVEAVHRGDSLYVLTNGRTLESLKMAAEDGSGMYICPDSLAKEQKGKIYTIVTLDGKHNNAAFSLRNVGDADNTFMIESNDAPTGVKGYSQVGSFAGAWVKIINGVPVLAKYSNANGNHNTGDTTDSWFEAGDYTDLDETTGEFINQGARFTFEVLDKDASATANEEITAGTVTVVATDGAVIVKGAEGKNVIVSTILGKVVANETINSDNETIAAPAGIVVVSVDGESFKVVVK